MPVNGHGQYSPSAASNCNALFLRVRATDDVPYRVRHQHVSRRRQMNAVHRRIRGRQYPDEHVFRHQQCVVFRGERRWIMPKRLQNGGNGNSIMTMVPLVADRPRTVGRRGIVRIDPPRWSRAGRCRRFREARGPFRRRSGRIASAQDPDSGTHLREVADIDPMLARKTLGHVPSSFSRMPALTESPTTNSVGLPSAGNVGVK